MKKRDRWHTKARNTKSPSDRKKALDLKHLVQREMRKAYWSYIEDIITEEGPEDCHVGERKICKKFWSYIKSVKKDSK